jgi:peptidylprolyl isomerase
MVPGCRSIQLQQAGDESPVMKSTESGLQYAIIPEGDGELAKDGDLVFVHYSGSLEDGSVFDSSHDRGEPISFKLGAGQVIAGWEEGIKMLRKGDKATFIIPPQLAYGENAIGPIPANATLTFSLELIDIVNPAAPLNAEGLKGITTENGVKIFVFREGDGAKLDSNMRVKVHYNGFLENDTLFDASYERGNPIEFVLGRGMVIPGLEDGLKHLKVGAQAKIWIPYQLAYGERGRGPIPAQANLIFDVEVLDAVIVENPKPFDVEDLPIVSTESGLQYIVLKEGEGELPIPGNLLLVHYSGYLEDGTLFDSSVQRGEPFRFILGSNQVIPAWDEGFALLKKGSKVRFIVPPELGYGDREVGPIPAGSKLIFDVELIDFQN